MTKKKENLNNEKISRKEKNNEKTIEKEKNIEYNNDVEDNVNSISELSEKKTIKERHPLKPKNDVVFQTLFSRGSENITKGLLEDILKIKINKIDLDKGKDLKNTNAVAKNGRLDVRAVLNTNIDCDIEVQLVPHEKMIERFLYYWSKMYVANLKEGEHYIELKKTISIIILDAEIPLLKKIPKSYSKWMIREEDYKDIILTDHFEMYIICMPKAIKDYPKNTEDRILQWMMFLNNPESMEVKEIMKKNKSIKEANDRLYEISQDEELQRQVLNEEIARMDEDQRIYDATQEGLRKGREEGRNEGKKNKTIEIVKRLSAMKMSINQVAEAVNLSEKEVEEILKK